MNINTHRLTGYHRQAIDAHVDSGTGNIVVHHNVENILKDLPDIVSIKIMRPAGFYTGCVKVYGVKLLDNGPTFLNIGGDYLKKNLTAMIMFTIEVTSLTNLKSI